MTAISHNVEKLRSFGLSVVAFGVVLAILVLGKSFLVPLAIAILLWHLLEALIDDLGRLTISRFRLPRWFATISRNWTNSAVSLRHKHRSPQSGKRDCRCLAAIRGAYEVNYCTPS